MAKNSNILVTMNVDKDIKEEAAKLFKDLGLSMSSAFSIFLRHCIVEGGIPFEINKSQKKQK